MPDFGDDFGDSLKRFSSMFLRELFHQWLRDSQKDVYRHETIGDESFDVKLFDDDAQREIFEQKLREAGIEFTEKTVPAVRFNTKDRKAIEKIYQEVIKGIDTNTYAPNKKEADFVASQPADAQTKYDLARLVDNGLLPKAALDGLGRDYTMGDALAMLDKHKDAKEQFLNELKYRAMHAEAAQEVDDMAKSDPERLGKPATQKQIETLNSAREQGILSDNEIKLMEKDGLTVNEASAILNQHPDFAGKLKAGEKVDIGKAVADLDKNLGERKVDEQSKDAPEKEEPAQRQEPVKEAPAHERPQPVKTVDERIPEQSVPAATEPEHSGPGYDMNDMTKNDARAVQAHDGGDADHHTLAKEPLSQTEVPAEQVPVASSPAPAQAAPVPVREAPAPQPADSWKGHIEKTVEGSFRKDMSITDFVRVLGKNGIGIQAARDGSLQYYLLDDPYKKLNSINTHAKLDFGDFHGSDDRNGGKVADKLNDNIVAAEKKIEAVRGVANPVAAVAHDAVSRGLPDAPTDPIR